MVRSKRNVVLVEEGLCTFEFAIAVEIFGVPKWATVGFASRVFLETGPTISAATLWVHLPPTAEGA